MNEYLVTFKATIPGLFGIFNRTCTEAKVFSGKTAQEAIEKAKIDLKADLLLSGLDPQEDGFTVTIVDVKKI